MFLLCDDPSVIGAIFFIMERRHGLVLRREIPPVCRAMPASAARVSAAFVDCLAALHAVDVDRVMLGKPAGFLERQVTRLGRALAARADRRAAADGPAHPLAGGPPAGIARAHAGAQRLQARQMMLDAADPGRVEAVLDWEMTTVGDPLVDLGLRPVLLAARRTIRRCRRDASAASPRSRAGTRARSWWSDTRGRPGATSPALGYYEVFGIFKMAVVLQQIYFRYQRGQTRDERFRDFGVRVRGLVGSWPRQWRREPVELALPDPPRAGRHARALRCAFRTGPAGRRTCWANIWPRRRVQFRAFIVGCLNRQQQTADGGAAGLSRRRACALPEIIAEPCWNEFDMTRGVRGICAAAERGRSAISSSELDELQRKLQDADSPIHHAWTDCDTKAMRAWMEGRFPSSTETWAAFRERVLRPRDRAAGL